jgi:hypothetical protein
MFELPSLHGVEEVVINKDVVGAANKPLMIYADRPGDVGSASYAASRPDRPRERAQAFRRAALRPDAAGDQP